jgi:uncharacterized lipoprotein
MTKIVMAVLCCMTLAACSSLSGSKPAADSGSSSAPAATNTTPNANQDQMHNAETGNPTISNKPTSSY